MKAISHINSGNCPKCEEILNAFGGTYSPLKCWFKDVQKKYSHVHVSCAGRCKKDQINVNLSGFSDASFGKSPHNYNPSFAIDLFITHPMYPGELYPVNMFNEIVKDTLVDWIEWYGIKGSKYYELPHFQVKDWKKIVIDEKIKLIYS